jgi:amidophosphoribosyltransferase
VSLTTLQHRGQDAAGILTYDDEGFHQVKNLGLVESVFKRGDMERLTGVTAIGHTRYGTAGRGDILEVQPFVLNYPYGIGMVHNGNLVNAQDLAQTLKKQDRRTLLSRSDTEALVNLFATGLEKSGAPSTPLSFEQICGAFSMVQNRAVGSYSCVLLIADHGLVAFRDLKGIRPLALGKRGEAWMVASESAALEVNGFHLERDLEPGEVLWIEPNGQVHSRVIGKQERRHCMFEWVYFASPDSVIEKVPVYAARLTLGQELASRVAQTLKEKGETADVIVPVPETSRIAAIALSEKLKIPYRELLIKNRYIKRTFILGTDQERRSAVELKLSPVRSEIQGKSVILVDDSIVRGTTSRRLIDLVRKAGARKVFFVSTCPPIQHPCFYGIDFPSEAELVAHGRNNKQIEDALGADAVVYLDVEGLSRGLSGAGGLCRACLTGEYPTDLSSARGMSQQRTEDRSHRGKA